DHESVWPEISGDRIVWWCGIAICMLDLVSGTERLVVDPFNPISVTFGGLAISGDRIVWWDSRNGNSNIYMFDLATGTERQIRTDPDDQRAHSPAISGDRIVWPDSRNGNSDIYMFDLATTT